MGISWCLLPKLAKIENVIFISLLLAHKIWALDREFTVNVMAGELECFFERANPGQVIEVDYQVVDGGHGDLDISFQLLTPSRVTVISDYKKSENTHRYSAQEEGDYQICFDNSISYMNPKTVFFELSIENEGSDENDDVWDYEGEHLEAIDDNYEMKIEDIKNIVNNVRVNTMKIKQFQAQFRTYEARDRNLAESNFTKVNNWSLVQIIIMMAVGAIQVVMLRSLFDEKSRMHRIWKLGKAS